MLVKAGHLQQHFQIFDLGKNMKLKHAASAIVQ
jgi:hypothetical protein